MKKIVLSILVMSSLMFASGKNVGPLVVIEEVQQDNIFYAGGSVSAYSIRFSESKLNFWDIEDEQDRLGNYVFHGGYWITEYLAVEGRYSFGYHDDDAIEMDTAWSIFLKPTYRFDDDENRANGENYFSVYGLLGYGNVAFGGQNSTKGNVDHSDFQWGLGVSYTFREFSPSPGYTYKDKWSISADYTSLGSEMEGTFENTDTRNIDLDALTVGISLYF